MKNHQNRENYDRSNFQQKKGNLVTWIVFLFTISVVLISLTSVVFPALIVSNVTNVSDLPELGIYPIKINPFEAGVWAVPLLVTNLVVLGIVILYFKKKLPYLITRSIDFIFSFEISKNAALVVIVVFLAIYVAATASELATEDTWTDYAKVKKKLDSWSIKDVTGGSSQTVRMFLLWSSMILFGNYKVIPFLASIALLITIYFITKEITEKRFPGIISMIILLQSNLFLDYDTAVTYTNFWILFYLLSLYMVYKIWPLSPISYLLSIFSKPLTAIFVPMSLFFIYHSRISRRKKIIMAVLIIVIISVGIIKIQKNLEGFDSDDFWMGFTSFSYQFRFDGLIILFILPLIAGLFIASRKGVKQAEAVMFLIGWMLFIAPLLTGFTEMTNQPYRFVPLVVFFAMGVGTLLSKRKI